MNHMTAQLRLPPPSVAKLDLSEWRAIMASKHYSGQLNCIQVTQAFYDAIHKKPLPSCINAALASWRNQCAVNLWHENFKKTNQAKVLFAICCGFCTTHAIVKATQLCLDTVKTKLRELLSINIVSRVKVGYGYVYQTGMQGVAG